MRSCPSWAEPHVYRLSIFDQIFISGAQHQLDSVQLIYLAGSRIVIDGYNIGFRMFKPQFFDDAFAHNVIGQAAEGLSADNIAGTAFDKL